MNSKIRRETTSRWFIVVVLLACLQISVGTAPGQQPAETVRAIPAPTTPLPPEEQSTGVTRFSFIAYGDTRSTEDGIAPQPVHTQLVDTMIQAIKRMQTSEFPVRFVLQSGDAVTNGRLVNQLNTSFIDVVSRLTPGRECAVLPDSGKSRCHNGVVCWSARTRRGADELSSRDGQHYSSGRLASKTIGLPYICVWIREHFCGSEHAMFRLKCRRQLLLAQRFFQVAFDRAHCRDEHRYVIHAVLKRVFGPRAGSGQAQEHEADDE